MDVLQGPVGLPDGQLLHEPVEGLAASVVVTGLDGFGERLLPKGCGEGKAVGAEIGQLYINSLAVGGGACFGECGRQTVGGGYGGSRRQGGAEDQRHESRKDSQENRTHVGSKGRFEKFRTNLVIKMVNSSVLRQKTGFGERKKGPDQAIRSLCKHSVAQATRSFTPWALSDSTTTVSPSWSLPSIISAESGSSTLSISVRLSERTP